MKIMNKDRDGFWSSRVNFIDVNNILVGYDMKQHCCEDADWFISESIEHFEHDKDYGGEEDLEPYCFDPAFFAEMNDASLGQGGQVIFRLTAEGEVDLYLSLYNSHNGYYAHGFTIEHNGHVIKAGEL